MYTSILWMAFAGFMTPSALDSPFWHMDYDSARKQGKDDHKPLAVFIGSGKAGWNGVSQDGKLGKEINQILARNYTCVYLDTNLKTGKHFASAFEVSEGLGLILSDHSGKYQAFRHEGDLPGESLARYLRRYADPERVVRTTETNPTERISYYAPDSWPAPVQPYYQPLLSYPIFVGGGSRGGC